MRGEERRGEETRRDETRRDETRRDDDDDDDDDDEVFLDDVWWLGVWVYGSPRSTWSRAGAYMRAEQQCLRMRRWLYGLHAPLQRQQHALQHMPPHAPVLSLRLVRLAPLAHVKWEADPAHSHLNCSPRRGDAMAAPADGVLDLERELSCSICTDVLFHPLTLLDCLHTFCGSCLKEWFAWQASSATTRHPYTCPACRATVRGTRPNATVTTLLDMFLKAHPERGKSLEDRQEMEKAYTPGDDVIPPVQVDEHSDDSEDERALAEARALSLNDTEPPGGPQRAHRRQRRRHDADSPGNTHSSYRAEDLGRAQRPSAFLAQRRQLERQSSLRSLMSASDLDSADMEEEIMRQIMEEGLLDGIDLNSLSATQEEEITERIAQAFRARQRERSRQQAPSSSSSRPAHSPAPRDRQHQRPPNSGTQQITSHPPPSRSHLLVGTAEGGQRRQHGRTSSSASQRSARSVASASDEASVVSNAPNTFTRSATDLSQRPRDELRPRSRRSSQSSRRRTTDPERRAGSAASHQERATMEDRPAQSTLLPGGRDSLDANPALAEVRTPTSLSALRISVIGFEDREGGPKRVVVRQMVGGWALKEDTDVQDHSSRSSTGPVPKWSWKESDGTAASVPSNLMAPRAMPPDGGVGLRARTKWSYFPPGEAHDELAFPRNAIISEVEDINGDWFWGVYAGKKGLFPGNYVKVI
ncbi:hypothetical protein MBLNU459_g7485t1 [Dothideomycetes sp. NU459]